MLPSLLLLHHHVGASGDALLSELNTSPALNQIPVVTIDDDGFRPDQLNDDRLVSVANISAKKQRY